MKFFGTIAVACLALASVMEANIPRNTIAEQYFRVQEEWVDRIKDHGTGEGVVQAYSTKRCGVVLKHFPKLSEKYVVFYTKESQVWILNQGGNIRYLAQIKDEKQMMIIPAYDPEFKECADQARRLPADIQAYFLGFHGIPN